MNRRGLLKGLFGASATAVVPLPLLLNEPNDSHTIVAATTAKPAILDACTSRDVLTDLHFSAEWPPGEGEPKEVTCHVMRETGSKILRFYLHPNGPPVHWMAMPGSEIIASPGNPIYLEWDETPCNVIAVAHVRTGAGDLIGIRSESNGDCFRVPVL